MSNRFLTLLQSSAPIVADGGMGTMLMNAGLLFGDPPEQWNTMPDKQPHVRAIHRGYLDAGAQLILTNSFGGTPFRLKLHNLQDRVFELNKAAAELARAEAGEERVVAGSMGPSGELFEPMGALTFDAAVAGFAAQAAGLAAGGADVLWVETMSDLQEVRAAVQGARQAAPDLPVVATMTFDTRGFTMMGVSPADAVNALAELGLAAIGGNCGNGPAEIEAVIYAMHRARPDMPLIAKSNAGMPELVGVRAVYSGTPEIMADYAGRVRAAGATIIGACCGSTPAHIAAIAGALHAQPHGDRAALDAIAEDAAGRYDAKPAESKRVRRPRRDADGATTYQVLYWHSIPSQVRAKDAEGRVSVLLPARFQEAIDHAAMAAGKSAGDDYTAMFRWGAAQERVGSAREVAEAVAAELDAEHTALDGRAVGRAVRKEGTQSLAE